MDSQKIEVLRKALTNFFRCARGSVFFKPEIFSVLDEAHFEDVNDWATQHRIKDGVTTGLAKHFPELEIIHNGLTFIFDTKSGDLDVEVQATFRSEDISLTFNLYKGVRNL